MHLHFLRTWDEATVQKKGLWKGEDLLPGLPPSHPSEPLVSAALHLLSVTSLQLQKGQGGTPVHSLSVESVGFDHGAGKHSTARNNTEKYQSLLQWIQKFLLMKFSSAADPMCINSHAEGRQECWEAQKWSN